MKLVSPRAALDVVAREVPAECRRHIVVIGSLAAAYQLFAEGDELQVRTKDIDCILVPRIELNRGKRRRDKIPACEWSGSPMAF